MTYTDELQSMVVAEGGPVKASLVADVMRNGLLPCLCAEVRRLSRVPNDRTPTTQEVGNALARLSGVFSKRDRTKTARWYTASEAEVPGAAVLPAANDVGHAGRPGAATEGVRVRSANDRGAQQLDALLKATRRPVQFARLCDVLDLSPSKVRKMVTEAQELGYTINVAGNEIGWQEPQPSLRDEGIVLPTVSGPQKLAVISDLHAGSKYFLRKQLCDFLDMAYDWAEGRLTVVSAGDNVDGCYKHGQWELSHHGLYEQIDDLLTTVKPRRGMDIYFIDGNHCGTFWDATGYPTGIAIEEAAKGRGRTDWHYVGNRGAMLKIGGARVELWHPKKSGSYSLSYHLQNKIRDTALGHKPDFLIAGHWHTWVALEQRGIHALAAGTFQGGGSAFSKSLGGAPSIGGTLLSWELTEHGTLRRVAIERVAYYEIEQPREVA
jgi:UDP-2,3-diacylglucosamine pyrophosphatase LpxH